MDSKLSRRRSIRATHKRASSNLEACTRLTHMSSGSPAEIFFQLKPPSPGDVHKAVVGAGINDPNRIGDSWMLVKVEYATSPLRPPVVRSPEISVKSSPLLKERWSFPAHAANVLIVFRQVDGRFQFHRRGRSPRSGFGEMRLNSPDFL